MGLPRGESRRELVSDATRLDSLDSRWASRSSLRYSSTEVNGNGVVRSGLLGHVFVLEESSIQDSPNKSSLFLGVADILLGSLVKLIDLNILCPCVLCLECKPVFRIAPAGKYPPLHCDARKQAKNQFSRFTIFVNKGSESVREFPPQLPEPCRLATK